MKYLDNRDNDDAPVGWILSRRELLRLTGATGIALAIGSNLPLRAESGEAIDLVAIPAVTEGPFFVDEKLNRSDITDTTRSSVAGGVPLTLSLRVFDVRKGKGTPLTGAHIDIWHCDTQGAYSDEVSGPIQGEDTSGQKWLRGYQVSDPKGTVTFRTIYPGWYRGRTVHIHFKVRTYSNDKKTYEFTSQLFFDDALSDTVFEQAPYNTRGQRRMRNANDGIYRGGGTGATATGSQLLLRPVKSKSGTGYVANFNIGIDFSKPQRRDFGGPGGPPPGGPGFGPGGPDFGPDQ